VYGHLAFYFLRKHFDVTIIWGGDVSIRSFTRNGYVEGIRRLNMMFPKKFDADPAVFSIDELPFCGN